MATFYGTAAAVKLRTGVKPEDLGLEDDAALVAAIEGLLAEGTDLMDRRMRRSYLTETTVPAGLDGIANDMISDALGAWVARRQTPVVRIDDFAVRAITATMLSRDVVERLRMYGSAGVADLDIQSGLFNEGAQVFITAADLDTMDL